VDNTRLTSKSEARPHIWRIVGDSDLSHFFASITGAAVPIRRQTRSD